MPVPAKPCDAFFSDEIVAALLANRNRERWSTFPCLQCGQLVGAVIEKGKWAPETHWPSVRYLPRTKRPEKRVSVSRNTAKPPQSEVSVDDLPLMPAKQF